MENLRRIVDAPVVQEPPVAIDPGDLIPDYLKEWKEWIGDKFGEVQEGAADIHNGYKNVENSVSAAMPNLDVDASDLSSMMPETPLGQFAALSGSALTIILGTIGLNAVFGSRGPGSFNRKWLGLK